MIEAQFVTRRITACTRYVRSLFQNVFHPRELHLHDNSGVRTIRISTRAQLGTAAGATALAGWTAVATIGMMMAGAPTVEDQAVMRMRSQVASLQAEVAAVKSSASETAARVEERQQFLTALLSGKADVARLAELMPDQTDADAPQGRFASVVSPLSGLEGRQFAFVRQASTAAVARYKDTEALLRRLALHSGRFLRQSSIAMGGPYEAADAPGAPLANADPQFKALFVNWTRLDQLQRSMVAVPALKPVKNFHFSSGFGVRVDPFNGGAAMHSGLDMAGPMGEPIYATADGVVDRAGWYGGYGNLVELNHGKGIQTRYGHLSRILVKPGEKVHRGDKIALMGSTGRSTGSHLHYEVRIDGVAVSPLPFLQSADALAAVQDRAAAMGGPLTSAAGSD